MKRYSKVVLFIVLIVCVMFTLTACDGFTKLPTDDFSKVQFAFKGVEKSFKNYKSRKQISNIKEVNDELNMKEEIANNSLSELFSLYSNGDVKNTSIDLSYNQPPMVQFQYLKLILDKVGSSYDFGTKYYDDITGEVYVNLEDGTKIDKKDSEKDQYKCDYTFRMSMCIDIDESDFITAHVSFNISLNQNGNSYNTRWYVGFLLDYDMNETTPNYELSMYTYNDERELSYIGEGYTYEYDYVNVRDNKIKEWRKFDLETSEMLLKDDNHQSFTSYLDEGLDASVGWCDWYKDDVYHKFMSMSDERKRSIGNILYSGIGLNTTDIDCDDFLNMNGTQIDVISSIYKEISKMYGDDIIYNLICKDDDEESNPSGPVKDLSVVTKDGSAVVIVNIEEDCNGYDFLFTERKLYDDLYGAPLFFKIDKNGLPKTKIDDLSGYKFLFFDASYNISGGIREEDAYINLDYEGFLTSSMYNILEFCNNCSNMVVMKDNHYASLFIYIEGGEGQPTKIDGIAAFNDDGTKKENDDIVKDGQVKDLFSDKSIWESGKALNIYCVDYQGIILGEKVNVDELEVAFSNGKQRIEVKNDSLISTVYNQLGSPKDDLSIEIKYSSFYLTINNIHYIVSSLDNSWNADLIDEWTLGRIEISKPNSENASFAYDNNQRILKISGLSESEQKEYVTLLNTKGYVIEESGYYNGYKFAYNDAIFEIPFYKEGNNLVFMFNYDWRGAVPIYNFGIVVNDNVYYDFKLSSDLRGYELTVTLNQGDNIIIKAAEGLDIGFAVDGINMFEHRKANVTLTKEYHLYIDLIIPQMISEKD